jgi:hypothetical protein
MMNRAGDAGNGKTGEADPPWMNGLALLVWLVAAVAAFFPFALDTSPWDAVTLRVPGNQGIWWHVLVGAPFFLAYPMIWIRLRALRTRQVLTGTGRRWIWAFVGLSVAGTILVETPFLLHLAGTSDWQRLAVLGLGFGIMVVSGALLFVQRRRIAPARACIAGLYTAYLSNAALCLVVYSGAPGSLSSRVGWFVTMVLFWPIAVELVWQFAQSYHRPALQAA